jgi:hypothetical protein
MEEKSKYWLLNDLCHKTKVTPLQTFFLQQAIRVYFADLGESLQIPFPYDSKNKFIYRARLNENFVFENKGDLFCPPLSLTKLGRANFPNKPIFYCAENPDVAIAEIKIPNKDCFVTVGQYKIKEGVELSLKSLGLHKTDRYNIQGASNDLIEIETVLMELFTKKAKDEDEAELYSKTATITNTVLEEESYHGIIYPSVQTEFKGDCIGMRPEIINEHFELTEVKLFEVRIDPATQKSLFKERLYALNFDGERIIWLLKGLD